jgi:hypothetical protein
MLLAHTVYRIPMSNELIDEFRKKFKMEDHIYIDARDIISLFRELYDLPKQTFLLNCEHNRLYNETSTTTCIYHSHRANPPVFYIVSNFDEYELTEEEKIKKEKIEKRKNKDKLFKAIFLPRLKHIFDELELEMNKNDLEYDAEKITFEKRVFSYEQDEFCLRELVKNKIKETVDEKLKALGINEYDLKVELNVRAIVEKSKMLQQFNNEGE